MRYDPLIAIVISPEFRARQEEQTPIGVPFAFPSDSVSISQNWLQFFIFPVLVEIGQPSVGRLFVICAIDTPMLFNGKIFGKIEQQVITGHGSSSEKSFTHPAFFKMVSVIFVRKNMNKKLSVWLEKIANLIQKILVILHVLEHLDCHDQVVAFHGIQSSLIIRYVALANQYKIKFR